MTIHNTFFIDAAHHLPNCPPEHKCRRIHGHTWRVGIYVSGPVDEEKGWIIDFADIGEAFKPLHDQLDHNYLNEVAGLENPTSENLARWIWERLKPALPSLCKVVVQETAEVGCAYEGERW